MTVPFDPTDPEFLQNPYPVYAHLRRARPIFFYEPWGKWIVTRHPDISALLRDRRLGRVLSNVKVRLNPAHAPFDDIQDGSLLELEPPDHTRIKTAVQDVFTPKHVRALDSKIAAICRAQAERLSAHPERRAELLSDFAEAIPVTVIAELLGVPEGDRHLLVPWSKAIIGMFEPERTPAMEAAASRAAHEFAGYVRELIERKRAEPQDDLISRMVALHDADRERLSESEIVANAILFLDAGHEAVVNVVGNGMVAILSRPDVWAALKAQPEGLNTLLDTAIEEALRFDTPLQFFERVVREDLEYGGFSWPRGTRLCLYYASGNRDETVFHAPETFDLTRNPNPHLSFGLGLHYCIGAPLARLELKHALHALITHVPNLSLASNIRYQPKNVFRYPDAVPVVY